MWKGLTVRSFGDDDQPLNTFDQVVSTMSEFMQAQRLSNLCKITTRACGALSPMVLAFYSAITGETAKLKADASVFTIADGIVQHLLVDHLFKGGKFASVVGEEEGSVINITVAPYKVDDLTVPEDFYGIIETARSNLAELSNEIHPTMYQDLTVFIDPIDGTREFSTELGEQCSICIGFSDTVGKPVAGVVYRPITQPPTYAAGAASEGFTESNLHAPAELQNSKGLLTSNGGMLLTVHTIYCHITHYCECSFDIQLVRHISFSPVDLISIASRNKAYPYFYSYMQASRRSLWR